MRICLFTASLNRGGAERVFVNLANHWVGLGHNVDFVVMSAAGGFRDELLSEVNLVDLGSSRGHWPLRLDFIRLFGRYLREAKPDQVFATLTYATITALWAAKWTGYTGRVVVRQANSLLNQSKQSLPVRLWNWFGYRGCYRWADTILVNSQNSADEVKRILPQLSSKVRLIHNPVVVPSGPKKNRLREAVPVVLASGRFTRQKDYPTLLRAFELVRRTCSAKLVVLGDGPDRKMIEQLIVELQMKDSVELVGFVSDTKQFYERASVFVLTSRWEGFPNVLVEALAAGVPVVATDGKGASREIVDPILPNNIVPVGDYRQLADRIVATLEAGAEREVYREYVRSRFDLPVIAKKYLEN